MSRWDRWWEWAHRVVTAYGLYNLVYPVGSAVISGIATLYAASQASSSALTPWVWLVTFLAGTALLTVATAFAVKVLRSSAPASVVAVMAAEKQPDPEYVALKEAATRAYEAARKRPPAEMAEAMAEGDTDKVLTWFCWSLWNHVPIFGAHPPSRLPELIDRASRNRYTFKIIDGELILQGHYGADRYVDLKVPAQGLPAAIDKIKALGSDDGQS